MNVKENYGAWDVMAVENVALAMVILYNISNCRFFLNNAEIRTQKMKAYFLILKNDHITGVVDQFCQKCLLAMTVPRTYTFQYLAANFTAGLRQMTQVSRIACFVIQIG